jgi:hypothetical protein
MKTKLLLFLAVLGMGLGVFACEKEGEDATSASFESLSKDLKTKQTALLNFYAEANKNSNGELSKFIEEHKGDEAAFQSTEFRELVDVKEFQVLANAFRIAYKKLHAISSETELRENILEHTKDVFPVNGSQLVGLPCYEDYASAIYEAWGELELCGIFLGDYECVFLFAWKLGNTYQRYLDCLGEKYPDVGY